MDNTYSKVGTTNNQPGPVNAVPIKMPKNIRQVGSIGARNKVIYVEDYVMTYIKQLSDKEYTGCRIAVLLGYYVRTEESKNIFIKGAVEMMNTDFSNGIAFTDEGWTSVYENIKKYFSDVEIVGWSLIGPEFFIESEEKIRKIHIENFSGPEKTLLKMDSMEKEEAFYLNENNQLLKQAGYYIYYEKNEEMQNYMVENKEAVREEKNYSDQTTRKIRNVIQEKKEVKDDRSIIRLLYTASTLLAIVVLVIAATMLDNYDKMRNMESALNTISENLNLVNIEGNISDDETRPEDGKQTDGETKAADGKQTDGETKAADGNPDDTSQAAQGNPDDAENPGTSEETAGNNETDAEDNQAADNGQDTTEVETVSGNINSSGKADTNSTDTAGAADNETDSSGTEETSNSGESPKEDSSQAPTEVKYYIVRAGDSLAAISYALYDTFSYMDEIKELNGIKDENKIYEGQKLIVP